MTAIRTKLTNFSLIIENLNSKAWNSAKLSSQKQLQLLCIKTIIHYNSRGKADVDREFV